MTKRKTDGDTLAFPLVTPHAIVPGMTLRDWFAGQALPGVIQKCTHHDLDDCETFEQMFAQKAYKIADAMISAREGDET